MTRRYRAVRAFHVFDILRKTFEPRPDLAHALCYELRSVDARSPEAACEVAFAHSNSDGPRASGYDGPSLSVGDLVEVDTPQGQTLLFKVAGVGFEPVADREAVLGARLEAPPVGEWRAPVLDLAAREVTPGTSWEPWLGVSELLSRPD